MSRFAHIWTSIKCWRNASLKLILARALFFCTRRLWFSVTTSSGYTIRTADALISYWDICVERSLDGEWVDNLSMQTSPLILDVGASHGAFTERVLQINPSAIVVALDPQSAIIDCRAQTRYQMAAGAFDGITTLSGCGTSACVGTGSLRIQQIKLDSLPLSRTPYLIKIDVEGGQEDVVAGAQCVLKLARYVIIEGPVSPYRMSNFKRKQLTEIDWLHTADIA